MTFDLEQIRAANPIEGVVEQRYILNKCGNTFTAREHDSLRVFPQTQSYYWFSRNEGGDVLDFVGRHLLNHGPGWNPSDPALFLEAVAYLCKRANIPFSSASSPKGSASWSLRELDKRLRQALLDAPAALRYLTHRRGLSEMVIQRAGLGLMPVDKRALLDDLNLPDQWHTVINKFPPNMIVFIYRKRGRMTYLSGRSIIDDDTRRNGLKQYKPPRDLLGEQQVYHNFSTAGGRSECCHTLTQKPESPTS